MFKKLLVLCAVTGLMIFSAEAQSTIDTLYYDKEWKGVIGREFANYYRVTITPNDPNFPKKFKNYDIRENYLHSEGTFVSIDTYDDSKSVFTNLFTHYYPNGQIMSLTNYNNGLLDGEKKTFNESGVLLSELNYKDNMRNGLCITYFTNGNIESSCMYNNDVVAGQYKTFTEEGKPIIDGSIENDLFTGIHYEYNENGILISSAEFKSDVLDGIAKKYFKNGSIALEVPYNNGLINGVVKYYNQAGVTTEELSFVNGLKSGICESRDGDNSKRLVYKEIIPSDGLWGISVTIDDSNYVIPRGNKAKTVDGVMMYRRGFDYYYKGYKTFFKEIGFYILNNSDKDINGSIRNLKVEYVKKNKSSKNMVISEEVAMNIYKEASSLLTNRVYANAANAADNAATQRTSGSSFGYGNSRSSASANTTKNSQSSVVGSILGAVLGVDNNGYAAAGVGGAVGRAQGRSSSNTTTQAYGENSSTSFNNTSETYVDGQLRYQVYQQEKEKADKYSDEINTKLSIQLEKNNYSDFVIPANSYVEKTILVANSKKAYDSIRVSFDYNGEHHSFEW